MVGKSKPATKAQSDRMGLIKECGCVCCLLKVQFAVPCDVHHIISGYRIGHDATIGLCKWHHEGKPHSGRSKQVMIGNLGPSLAHGSRAFVEEWGTEADLLQVQDLILTLYQRYPWVDYSPNWGVLSDIQQLHSRLRRENDPTWTPNIHITD